MMKWIKLQKYKKYVVSIENVEKKLYFDRYVKNIYE